VTSFTVILRPLDYGTASRGNQSFRDNSSIGKRSLADCIKDGVTFWKQKASSLTENEEEKEKEKEEEEKEKEEEEEEVLINSLCQQYKYGSHLNF
jgi:hypothetical protein